MRTFEISKAKKSLATFSREIKREPVIVTRRGKPIAALVAIQNADMETVSLSNNPKFLVLIARSRRRHKTNGGIPPEEMRRRLKIK
jgi:antitoxin (DNA-binding transcriptional repressor) of toxin-antitoxin stability system